MSLCTNCGNPIPEEAKFCPVCGTPVTAMPVANASAADDPEADIQNKEPVVEDSPAAQQEASSAGWYQAAEQEAPQAAAPVYYKAKPAIGSIFDFYRKAFDVLRQKPIRLWGISLLYVIVVSLISSLGSLVPIITIPIVLVISLGFTGVLLNGYHGKDVRSEQLFLAFRKEEIVRNGAGMCWKELWTMIWAFVPVMNIIKAYSYSFVPYILLTDKEISATEALRKSMRMTDGYKGKMFGADVLIVVGFVVAMIVLGLLGQIPYIGWIFMIALVALYLAFILFGPLFLGLVRTSLFEAISGVHEE